MIDSLIWGERVCDGCLGSNDYVLIQTIRNCLTIRLTAICYCCCPDPSSELNGANINVCFPLPSSRENPNESEEPPPP